ALSERIAVMNAGKIEQVGAPKEIYERPRNRFVAQFLGSCNLLPATVKARSSSAIVVETPIGELQIASNLPPPRDQFTLTIRPENLQLSSPGSVTKENCVQGKIIDLIYSGAQTEWFLAIGNQTLRVSMTNAEEAAHQFDLGQIATVHLPSSALI